MTETVTAPQLLEQIAGRAEAAEVYEQRIQSLPVAFRGNALESVKSVETAGRALRLIAGGRVGYSTTTDLTDGAALIDNALQSAQFGDLASFRFPGQQPLPEVAWYDPAVEQLDEGDLIALGEAVIDRFAACDPELQVDISLERGIEDTRILNTAGLAVDGQRTFMGLSIEITRAREGDIWLLYDWAGSARLGGVDGLALADRLIERLRWADQIVPAPSGTMPVAFSQFGLMALLLPLMMGLSGRNVHLGTSPLEGKIGEQAFDRRFSLIDDGRLPYATRSRPYDDEGVPTAATALIEEGIVRQFLYDLKTAGQAGAESTGNGFKTRGFFERGFRPQPGISPTSWSVPPGQRRLPQILGELEEALIVEQVIGLGQGNVMAGEFSNNVSAGFLVRRGEIVGRVKNTMIAGNVYELLRERLIALSDTPSWTFGLIHAPAVVVEGVAVASQ